MRPGDKGSDNTGFQIWVFGPQVHAADLPKCWATESLTHQPHLGLRVSMWGPKRTLQWAQRGSMPLFPAANSGGQSARQKRLLHQ